jgi:phosphate starvation-inducible protein PhoH and related proteins
VIPPSRTLEVFGDRDSVLRRVEELVECEVVVRGNEIVLRGTEAAVERAEAVFDGLVGLSEEGHHPTPETAERLYKMADGGGGREVLGDVILTHRGRRVAPKTRNQKAYTDAIRQHQVVFGIGPAGTGKTYLAVALAVEALNRGEVSRIILTRPAVEAGESLGYLPGDVMAKVDPYFRPLYDALYEMVDPARFQAHLERGIIEIAPLAFMRGRAQPLQTEVPTPLGWRELGNLEEGDWVIGSNGKPAQVLGVYPQGRKEVFRVTMTDGSSTLACAEHLWAVRTASDNRKDRPMRILETREMMGRLRAAHQYRYELPLVSAPATFATQEVPLDPYALGLLIGDGCLTGSSTPFFATADPELAEALEQRLEGIRLVRKSDVDYVLQNTNGGGVIVANPVTESLRAIGLIGTRSNNRFVPESYLNNDAAVRLAMLQGLLDTDGGPVVQEDRSCRIQYTTTSSRLRDDVVYLVRSLGGVARSRTRSREVKRPGLVRGRIVVHRSDSYVLDIRLPDGVRPFRLSRKAEIYARHGGGGPMRFIKDIEPVGVEETVCIRVSAPDHLYVTEDFIVTHNTLNDAFIILDEAQNTTPQQMKMFLTRLGFGSKMVITGDVTQVDLPKGRISGLQDASNTLTGVEGVSFVGLRRDDIVRSDLVMRIVDAYEGAGEGDKA